MVGWGDAVVGCGSALRRGRRGAEEHGDGYRERRREQR